MSEEIQKFILNYTKGLQRLVNQKLAKRKGVLGDLSRSMKIGERHYGEHVIRRWFRL